MASVRSRSIALWVLCGLLALTYVVTGVSKVADVAPTPQNFARWGLSPTFMHAIGVIEIVGGLALLVPRLASLASLLLAATMVGAIRTGIVFREPLHIALPAVLLVLLALVGYGRRRALRGS